MQMREFADSGAPTDPYQNTSKENANSLPLQSPQFKDGANGESIWFANGRQRRIAAPTAAAGAVSSLSTPNSSSTTNHALARSRALSSLAKAKLRYDVFTIATREKIVATQPETDGDEYGLSGTRLLYAL